MKSISMRDLNRRTARILDEVEGGETFELKRNGKAVGYLSRTAPVPERKTSRWDAHFEWLEKQRGKGGGFIKDLESDRKLLRDREKSLEKPA